MAELAGLILYCVVCVVALTRSAEKAMPKQPTLNGAGRPLMPGVVDVLPVRPASLLFKELHPSSSKAELQENLYMVYGIYIYIHMNIYVYVYLCDISL